MASDTVGNGRAPGISDPISELCDLPAVRLRQMIGDRDISPVELLESCRRRIDRVNPVLNAVVTTCWERAEDEARAAEAVVMDARAPLGPLHGLPLAIKDLEETEGVRTTFGSPLYADHVPKQDDAAVAAVRRAGAIVVGKTNTPEFGAGGHTTNAVFGATRNPFDPALTAGGSSGGSAVAVASGMLPLCTGSDTGGSLRIPAAFCGVVGFRPSPGLIAASRRPFGWSPLPVLGPLARDVADAALLLSGMTGVDRRDPLSVAVDGASLRQLEAVEPGTARVAFSEDLGFAAVSAAVRAAFRERIERIGGLFATCVAAAPDLHAADDVFAILRGLGYLARYKKLYAERRGDLGPNIIENYEQALRYTTDDVAWAHAEHTRIYRAFQTFFDRHDLLVTPTVPIAPFAVEERTANQIDGIAMRSYFHWLALTYGLTLAGHPVISIPCGLGPAGMPFGLQICAGRGQDRFLLGAAHALMQRWADQPDLARPVPAPGGGAATPIREREVS